MQDCKYTKERQTTKQEQVLRRPSQPDRGRNTRRLSKLILFRPLMKAFLILSNTLGSSTDPSPPRTLVAQGVSHKGHVVVVMPILIDVLVLRRPVAMAGSAIVHGHVPVRVGFRPRRG